MFPRSSPRITTSAAFVLLLLVMIASGCGTPDSEDQKWMDVEDSPEANDSVSADSYTPTLRGDINDSDAPIAIILTGLPGVESVNWKITRNFNRIKRDPRCEKRWRPQSAGGSRNSSFASCSDRTKNSKGV